MVFLASPAAWYHKPLGQLGQQAMTEEESKREERKGSG